MGAAGSTLKLKHEAATEDFVKSLFTDKNKLNNLFDAISEKQKFFSPDKITFQALEKYFHNETHPFFLRFVTDDAIIKAAYGYVMHTRKKDKSEKKSGKESRPNVKKPGSIKISPKSEAALAKKNPNAAASNGNSNSNASDKGKSGKEKESTESAMIKKTDFPFLMAVIYLFSHVYEIFVKIDVQNSNGVSDNKISKHEFIASKDWILNSCSAIVNTGEISDAQWQEAFKDVDGNGNGEVSFIEMCQYVVRFITDVDEFSKFDTDNEEEEEVEIGVSLLGDLEDVTKAMMADPNQLSMYSSGNSLVKEAELLAKVSMARVQKVKNEIDEEVGNDEHEEIPE